MSAAPVLEMPLYDPDEAGPPMVAITFRVPKELVSEMDAVVRLWRTYAVARGDEARNIDRSSVMRKLLRKGYEAAFAEFGGLPVDADGWARIEAAIIKSLKSSKR